MWASLNQCDPVYSGDHHVTLLAFDQAIVSRLCLISVFNHANNCRKTMYWSKFAETTLRRESMLKRLQHYREISFKGMYCDPNVIFMT